MATIGMIGLGNFGTAIAHVLTSNGHAVIGWDIQKDIVAEIQENHINTRYLPSITLSPLLQATNNLHEVLTDTSLLFVAIPARYIHGVFADYVNAIDDNTICVNLAKGMDVERGETAFTILQNTLPQCHHWVLSGPSIANEFVQGHPTQVVLAGGDKTTYQHIAETLNTSTFHTQFSDDVLGTEWGGIIKNIYAIGLGLLPAPRAVNTQAMYLNRTLDEMGVIFELLGSHSASAYALPALGDFLATALSPHSHNRGLGETVRDNPDHLKNAITDDYLPEGYYTLQYMLRLASERDVKLPIAESIHAVLHQQKSSQHIIDILLSKTL